MRRLIVCLLILFASVHAFSQRKLTVQADKIVTQVPSTMWGVFFEDINFAADGGLYAEMVKNGSFEFPLPMMGWDQKMERWDQGRILVINKSDNSTNAKFARVTNSSQDKSSLDHGSEAAESV